MGDVRVCHLLHDLALGGLENQVLRIVRATDDPTITFLVCYVGADDSMGPAFEAAGARVVHLDTGSPDPIDQFRPRSLWRLARFLREYDVDVLHCHGSLYQHVVGRLCARAVGRRVMGTYHTRRDTFQTATQWLERLTRPLSSVDVAVSKGVELTYASSARVYRPGQAEFDRRTYTVYNGIDVESFNERVRDSVPERVDPRPPDDDGVVFLTIGRYSAAKNQLTLIEAMGEVVSAVPDAHLILVGWGELESSLRSAVRRTGLEEHVTVAGRVSAEYGDVPSVYDYYALADVFVLPSLTEGLSVVLLEAMAAGLPIVASRIPGNDEAVVDDQTGSLVPADSVDALARAMIAMADDDRGDRFGERAYEHAQATFHIDYTVAAYVDLYHRVS